MNANAQQFTSGQTVICSMGRGTVVRRQGAGGYMVRFYSARTIVTDFARQTRETVNAATVAYFRTETLKPVINGEHENGTI